MHAAAKSSFKTKAGQTNLAPELRSRIANHIHVLPRLWILDTYEGRSEFIPRGRAAQSQAKPLSRQLPSLQGPERNGKLHFFSYEKGPAGALGGWIQRG